MKKRDLTKQKICLTAIELITLSGLENLTMRNLAKTLNIEAASLYNHIANKDAIFDLIQEHLYAQIPLTNPTNDWYKHLFELAMVTRQSLKKVPNCAILFATRPSITLTFLERAEITMSLLIKAGFEASEVMTIYRNLHVYIIGEVLAEVGRAPGHQDGVDPSIKDVDLTLYPTLKKVSRYKSNFDFDKGFKLGLTTFLNGLTKRLNEK